MLDSGRAPRWHRSSMIPNIANCHRAHIVFANYDTDGDGFWTESNFKEVILFYAVAVTALKFSM